MIDRDIKRIAAEWAILFAFVAALFFCLHGCNSTAAAASNQQIVPIDLVLEKALSDALAAPTNVPITVGGDTNGPYVYPVYLRWNASPDSTVTGYNAYFGVASRTYTNLFSSGMTTNVTVVIDWGSPYYFAATAYNALGVESALSDEVWWSGKYFSDRATITWPTNPPASLIVSANPALDRSKWTMMIPAPNLGTVTVLIGPGAVFFALEGTTNLLYIRGWNPRNSP